MQYLKQVAIGGGLLVILLAPSFWGLNIEDYSLLFGFPKLTVASPLFNIKLGREFLQSKFVFGDEDSAYFYYQLAQKRLEEASFLKKRNLLNQAYKELSYAKQYQEKSDKLILNLKDKVDINYLLKMQEDNKIKFNDFKLIK